MTLLEGIVLVIVAAVCGSLGMAISGFSRGGCLVAIALGFIGAVRCNEYLDATHARQNILRAIQVFHHRFLYC